MSDDEKKLHIVAKIDAETFKLEVSTDISKSELEKTLDDLISTFGKSVKKIEKTFGEIKITTPKEIPKTETITSQPFIELSEPMINIARKMGVEAQKLIGNNLFGFKGNKPQIFDPSKFKSANTAVRALVYLFEIGLGRKSVTSQELREAYDISKIKGRKIYAILQDLKKTGIIETKEIVLTARGTMEAENEIKALLML